MEVGQGKVRVDAYAKVCGEAKYTADLEPKNILHGKVLHSEIANGLVKSMDISEAEKVPGVVKVLTCFDVPDCQFPTAGHPWSVEEKHQDICDRRLLNRRVRFYGDDIACVIAEDEVAAQQALRKIKVEYEEYPAIPTVEQAMAEGATPLHPDLRKDNVIVHSHMTMGKADFSFEKALEEAKKEYGEEELVYVEEKLDTPRISHCHIELPVSWAYVDNNGKVTVTCSTQIPAIVKLCTAMALGIPTGKVRIIKPYIGGGFGNKQDVLYEPLNAFMSMQVGGRPVRLEISREETIISTRTRHKITGYVRGLAKRDGTILARSLDAYANNGAYASHGHAICANCCTVFKDLYRDRMGTEADGWTVYTSSPTAGAMRAYGIPQSIWFTECLVDDLAKKLGMDPYELRMKNCMEEGFRDPGNGITFRSYGLKQCMEKGAELFHWTEKREKYGHESGMKRRGVGMAIFCYKTGVHPISLETASARMVLNQDGSAQLIMGATEIGQGADTVFTQMAADTSGLRFDEIYIVSTQDTDVTPFDTGAYASRQTYVSGMACKKVAEEFRSRILDYAAYMLNNSVEDISKTIYAKEVSRAEEKLRSQLSLSPKERILPEMLEIVDSRVVLKEGGEALFPLSILADTAFYSLDRAVHITAEVSNQCKDNTFSSGVCFAEVEVDLPLGLVKILDLVELHDSGIIINRKTAEGQVHGGIAQSIGYALSEDLLVDEKTGRVLNDNLLDFKIPTAMDVPDMRIDFVELEDPTGPYGNKSLGEPPTIAAAPAIRNAVLQATGIGMKVAPMTSQRLIEAFQEGGLL
ncbi:xanthine dehydrogenase subunit XdhA [Oribacterium sp. oral taxon 078]|uniref:xanthine dehydrogenase subunit XdhA n=1 Tax=Oribacterium sp. oral taxon 078 TaxID=652706 RepID=UPI000563831F|nr:xanthine dehydrogenase subunit XdhA [Oribacterium sp. oral taxon 078]